jgi:hypothetical protein
MQKFNHNIGVLEKRHFLPKIAENFDLNIDPLEMTVLQSFNDRCSRDQPVSLRKLRI